MIPRYIKYIRRNGVQMGMRIEPFVENRIYDTTTNASIYTRHPRGWDFIALKMTEPRLLDTTWWEESTEEAFNAQQVNEVLAETDLPYGEGVESQIITTVPTPITEGAIRDYMDELTLIGERRDYTYYNYNTIGIIPANYIVEYINPTTPIFDNTQEGIVSFEVYTGPSQGLIYNRINLTTYDNGNDITNSSVNLLSFTDTRIKSVRNIHRQLFTLGDNFRIVSNRYNLTQQIPSDISRTIKSIEYYDGTNRNPRINRYGSLRREGIQVAMVGDNINNYENWVHIDDIELVPNVSEQPATEITLVNGDNTITLNELKIILLEEFNREDVNNMLIFLDSNLPSATINNIEV